MCRLDCLNNSREVEANRPERDNRTETQREYEARPEVKAKRIQRRRKQSAVIIESCLKYHLNQIKTNGDNYRAKNAKRGRDKRAERQKELIEVESLIRRTNQNKKLSDTKASAKTRGIVWELNDEDAIKFFTDKCFYCHYVPDNTLNGIGIC